MENCESGCPCAEFNCDLSLNVTDPVIGLESMGILDTSGKEGCVFLMVNWPGFCLGQSRDDHPLRTWDINNLTQYLRPGL